MKQTFHYFSIIFNVILGLFVLVILIRGQGTLADYMFVIIDFLFVIPLTIIKNRSSKFKDADTSQN